ARLSAPGADPGDERRRAHHLGAPGPAAVDAVRAGRAARSGGATRVDESAVVRDDALEQLGSREVDLLVIGGGIVGPGIAAAASRHGLAVALVDRKDFGGGTSRASSELIHGGHA